MGMLLWLFTQNPLLIQENCAKIVCCGKNCVDSQICQNCAAQLRNFLVGLKYNIIQSIVLTALYWVTSRFLHTDVQFFLAWKSWRPVNSGLLRTLLLLLHYYYYCYYYKWQEWLSLLSSSRLWMNMRSNLSHYYQVTDVDRLCQTLPVPSPTSVFHHTDNINYNEMKVTSICIACLLEHL